MRRMILLLYAVLLFVTAMGSDSPKQHDENVEIVGVEGTWRLTKYEFGGRKMDCNQEMLTFRAGSFTTNYSDGRMIRGSCCIDPTRKPPHLDLIPANGIRKGQTVKCIYQIDGDTLRIADNFFNAQRPQGFNDDGAEVWTYKRVKE